MIEQLTSTDALDEADPANDEPVLLGTTSQRGANGKTIQASMRPVSREKNKSTK